MRSATDQFTRALYMTMADPIWSASCSLNSPQVGVGKLTQKKKVQRCVDTFRVNILDIVRIIFFKLKNLSTL